jgi:hypothetical protein
MFSIIKQIIIIITAVILFSCNLRNDKPENKKSSQTVKTSWDLLKTEDSFLIFKNGKKFNTQLHELKYIESLNDNSDNPYFVLAGRPCGDCDANISIYFVSPIDSIKSIDKLQRYAYPGKINDWETSRTIFESKLFIGNCINNGNNSKKLVWIQKSIDNKNIADSLIFIVDVLNNKLRENVIKSGSSLYSQYKQEVINCKEIEGIDNTSEP